MKIKNFLRSIFILIYTRLFMSFDKFSKAVYWLPARGGRPSNASLVLQELNLIGQALLLGTAKSSI